MYIYKTGSFIQPVKPERGSLKEPLRTAGCSPLRRAGRFNRLAVLGAMDCCDGFELPPECNLILSTVNGTIANTAAMLDAVILQHQIPMPFDFMNSQNNSACFNIAKELAIKGSSLVCMHPDYPLEAAILMAISQWSGPVNRPSLVGLVDEWTLDLYLHPTGYVSGDRLPSQEGSCWFLLHNESLAEPPLGCILELTLMQSACELRAILDRHSDRLKSLSWDLDERSWNLLTEWGITLCQTSHKRNSPLEAGLALSDWLRQGRELHYCRLRGNANGDFCLLLLERNPA